MTRQDTYTHGHHESVLRSHQWRSAANSAAYLLPHLAPGMSLLDIGCGPGTITLDLAEVVSPGRVVGFDVVADPLDAARVNAEARGDATTEFGIGDVYDLDLPDDSVDVVHAHQVLQHLSDPVAALREMRRVCRPGGLVAVRDADYAAMTWWPATPELDRWLALYRAAATANGGEPDAGRRLLSWALAAGFEADAVAPSAGTWCYATSADRAWWAGTWAERTTRTVLAEQLVAAGLADQAELDGIGAAWLRWAELPDAWFIVPNGELICRA